MEGGNLMELIKDHPEHLFDFHNWKRSVDAYDLAVSKPYEAKGSRGIWLYGKTNTGKTYFARQISIGKFGWEPYMKDQNKWWDNYTNQPVVILDDADETMLYLT